MPAPSILRRALPWVVLVAVVVLHGTLDVRRRARLDRGPSFHRTDLTVYLAASEALQRGEDPYEARSPRGWRYVYPPLLAVLLQPLTGLPVENAALLFYGLSVAALVLAWRALVHAIGPPSGRFAAWAALVLAAPFLLQTFQRGQVTTLLLWSQASALLLLLRGRDAWAGVALAFGTALRLTPLLAAAMLGLASLRTLRRDGWRRFVRIPAGFLAGLVLFFAVVPAIALGPERALDVTERWIGSSRAVYAAAPGDLVSLERDYSIREHHFKNQGVRRVIATWMGEDPSAPASARPSPAAVDVGAWAVGGLIVLALAAFCWRGLSDRSSPTFRRAWALAALAPVFVTRYAWPIHYVVAIPFFAECLGGRRPFHAAAAAVFAAGTVLFYAGHAQALHALPDRGVLVLAALVAAVWLAARDLRARRGTPTPDLHPPAYADDHPVRHLHRVLRWARGGLDEIVALLPSRGLVVDLGAGEGLLAHRLVRRASGVRVVAIDHDAGRLARLGESAHGLAVETLRARLEDAVPPRCAAVAAVDVLHYLDRAAQERCLRRAFDALEPGGTLVLRDPDAGAGARFLRTRVYERLATTLGVTRARIGAYRRVGEWEELLRGLGFETRVLPAPRRAFSADRVVVATKPRSAT